MNDSTSDGPLTVAQASTYASCHPKTMLRALRRGDLLGYQRGASCTWRIYREDLDRWIRGEQPKKTRRAA
jgi:excisionase family DNA binding protein